MTERKCISGDSHIVEPPEVFEGLYEKFGEKAPRIVEDAERGHLLRVGARTTPVGRFGIAGNRLDDPKTQELMNQGYAGLRKGVFDPAERLKDQGIDGVDLEVVYPSMCMAVFGIDDPRIVSAAFSRYNDWLTEYCSHAPDRLAGLACISLHDIEEAVQELERVAKQGFVGVCVACTAPKDRPYSDPAYDPFWRAAEEAGLPVTMHIFTGAIPGMDLPESWDPIQKYTMALSAGALTIGTLITSGVRHRFPKLKFVPTEWETGWVAHYLERLDHAAYRTPEVLSPDLNMLPSEYFRRQFYVTFEDGRVGLRTADFIGADNLVWGNDYPHHDSIWPHSQRVLEEAFLEVPEDRRAEYRRKMTLDNVTKLYNLS